MEGDAADGPVRAHPQRWAAWVVSGAPGDLSAMRPVSLEAEQPLAEEAAAHAAPTWPWFAVGAVLGAAVAAILLRRTRRRPAASQAE